MNQQRITAYHDFLRSKAQIVKETGFQIPDSAMHESLFAHQRDAIRWAAHRGKALIAASFGMGKTRIQIELLRQAIDHTQQPVLVICPLGVRHQFVVEDGPAMGVEFQYVRTDAESAAATTPYLITNYERGVMAISQMPRCRA